MIFGKSINKYYIKYLVFFIIGFVCLVTVDWFQLKLPEYLGNLVDLISAGNISNDVLLDYIFKILGIAAILFFGRAGWRFSLFYASRKIESDIRHDMFVKAENLSTEYFYSNKIGSIMSWLTSDLETLEEYLSWGTLMMIDSIFLTIFALIKMFSLDWAISLLALIPIVFIAVWAGLVEKMMGKKWTIRQEAYDQLYDYSQENFSGIRVIKAFVKENQQIKKFATIAKLNMDVNVDFFKSSILFDVIIEIIVNFVFCFILGFGGFLVYSSLTHNAFSLFGEFVNRTPGYLISYIGYFDTLIWPMIALGQVVTMFSKARASYKRIEKFLFEKEDIVDVENARELTNVKGEIEFKNFSFRYAPNKPLYLNNISLKIKAGELIGVVGKVGCGKTTLITSLLRLYNLNRGQVFIDEQDIMDLKIKSVRAFIAYVPQDNFLFSDSIKENICYGVSSVDDEKIKNAALFSDVEHDINEFKNKYETISGERGQTLSGGQKQRIAISRAFIKDAPIMILDDSVSAVDVKTEEAILNNIKKYRSGKTTIVVASRLSTIKDADRVIVLNNGELEAFDTPDNLNKISKTYQTMNQLQALEGEVNDNER